MTSTATPSRGPEDEPPTSTSRRHRRLLIGAAGLLAPAIASAIAAAIITPDSFRSFIGIAEGGVQRDRDSAGDADVKRVSSPQKAVSMEVPTTWATSGSHYGEDGDKLFSGEAVTAGEDPDLPFAYTRSRAYVGASEEHAQVLGLASESEAGLRDQMRRLTRSLDWTQDGCSFDREVERLPDGLVGVYRVWQDCADVPNVLYDGYFTAPDGAYVATFQIILPSHEVPSDVADHIVSSLRVLPERIPDAPARGGAGGPRPSTTSTPFVHGDRALP